MPVEPRLILTEGDDEDARLGERAARGVAMLANRVDGFVPRRRKAALRLAQRIEPPFDGVLDEKRKVGVAGVEDDLAEGWNGVDASPIRGRGEEVPLRR